MHRYWIALLAVASLQAAPSLMPLPAKMTVSPGHLKIDSSFQIAATAFKDARLDAAMRRTESRIFRQFGFATILPKRTALTVECRAAGPALPTLGEDESYQLDVTPEGARIIAPTVTGAVRAMATFVQLIEPDFQAPAVHIEDRPRFPWRGLMIDASRHWMPVEVIKRSLEAMAAVKLNVLHWHLADDQGFRVESKRYPKLQELGSDGQFYKQSEIAEVVAFARDRGIRVIPEFDIPGHTTSWFVGYPELASAPGPYRVERTWGIFEPTMNPASEHTYEFLDGFLGEMAALFPDPFFHIGGDEVEETQWKRNPPIQAFAREHSLPDSKALHLYFNQRVQQILTKHGKILVGWDEVLAPGLAEGAVIQSWRGQQGLADAAAKGYRGILSFGFYLDYLKPAAFHYAVDPLSGATAALPPAETARILGGEACMWAEYVSAETVDSRIWPRMAAVAERFWSPRDVKDADSMYARLEVVSRGLEWTGIRHRAASPEMLDRLGGGEPVRTLAAACESTGIDIRRDARKYSSLIDLNRFVDAVPPESEFIRDLEHAAARRSPADLADLKAAFQAWASIHLESPGELQQLARRLAALGAIGLRALEDQAVSESWITEQKKSLDAMEKPEAEVILAAVRPVRIMLNELSRKAGSASGGGAPRRR